MFDLQREIAYKEEMKKQAIREKYEEGKAIKDKDATIKKMIEKVRKEKLDLLKSYNIPEKYQLDLAKKKF